MPMNRRNILTVLGVAAASTPAFAAEKMNSYEDGPRHVPGLTMYSPEAQELYAKALCEAAAAIRRGELSCIGMDIHSKVRPEEWMEHKVTFTFELLAEMSGV